MFEQINIIEVFQWTGLLLLGAGLAYYRTNAKLRARVGDLIGQAEKEITGAKVGGKRFEWVCDQLYGIIPAPLKAIITRQMVSNVVQGAFDAMAAYARTQLDKAVERLPDPVTGGE